MLRHVVVLEGLLVIVECAVWACAGSDVVLHGTQLGGHGSEECVMLGSSGLRGQFTLSPPGFHVYDRSVGCNDQWGQLVYTALVAGECVEVMPRDSSNVAQNLTLKVVWHPFECFGSQNCDVCEEYSYSGACTGDDRCQWYEDAGTCQDICTTFSTLHCARNDHCSTDHSTCSTEPGTEAHDIYLAPHLLGIYVVVVLMLIIPPSIYGLLFLIVRCRPKRKPVWPARQYVQPGVVVVSQPEGHAATGDAIGGVDGGGAGGCRVVAREGDLTGEGKGDAVGVGATDVAGGGAVDGARQWEGDGASAREGAGMRAS